MPIIHPDYLSELLKEPVRFTVEMKKMATQLASMHPSDMSDTLACIVQILTLRQRNITQAILAVRLVKESLLLAQHSFYMMTIIYILPALRAHADTSSTPIDSLCKAWSIRQEDLSQAELSSFSNFLLIVKQFICWFSQLIPQHPFPVQGRAHFRSHFSLVKQSSLKNCQLSNYTFFREEESEFYQQRYRELVQESPSLSEQKWKAYCAVIAEDYISNRSPRQLQLVGKVLATGDPHAVTSVLDCLQNWITDSSSVSVEQLGVCHQLCAVGDIQFDYLVQTQLLPHFFGKLFSARGPRANRELMLKTIESMFIHSKKQGFSHQILERILHKAGRNLPSATRRSDHGHQSLERMVSEDKRSQVFSLNKGRLEEVVYEITHYEIETSRSSFQYRAQDSFGGREQSVLKQQPAKVSGSPAQPITTFAQIVLSAEPKDYLASSRRSGSKMSSRSLSKKGSLIQRRRESNRLHNNRDSSSSRSSEYFHKQKPVKIEAGSPQKKDNNEYGMVDKAWKRMQNKPGKKKVVLDPSSLIYIEHTIKKPRFGFKAPNMSTEETQDYFESRASTDSQSFSVKPSRFQPDASNFMEVLKFEQESKLKVLRSGDTAGYLLSRIDNKEGQMSNKLEELRRYNDKYDLLLRQKERDIQSIRKKIERQEAQAEKFELNLLRAYDHYDNPDSLLMNSRDYEATDERMDERVSHKSIVKVGVTSLGKKLFKQILYGKCLLFENDYIQVGFDGRAKGVPVTLYFTFKKAMEGFECELEGIEESGFQPNEDFHLKIANPSAGKRIKAKLSLVYVGSFSDNMYLLILKMKLLLTSAYSIVEGIPLPVTLYRNCFSAVPFQSDVRSKKKSDSFRLVSQWERCRDELSSNPRQFLDNLLGGGCWEEEGVYCVGLQVEGLMVKRIKILMNGRNFAIEMEDTQYMNIVAVVISLLASPY